MQTVQAAVIMEESSKENSSDSSTGDKNFKEKLLRDILNHTLQSILRNRMRPELYEIFQNKYGVQTFEQNQEIIDEVQAYLDIIYDDINPDLKLYVNYPVYKIDFRKLDQLALTGVKEQHINVQQVNTEAILRALRPYFDEENAFFSKLSAILLKILNQETFNDEEQFIVSQEKPFPLPKELINLKIDTALITASETKKSLQYHPKSPSQLPYAYQPQSYDASSIDTSFINATSDVDSLADIQLRSLRHPVAQESSMIESSEMGDSNIGGGEQVVDDIQQSILKAQKQMKNKLKKQKKKQRKHEKVIIEQTQEVIEEQQNPLLRQILLSFAEEESSHEMMQAVKAVHQSPIIGQVLLQLYLRLKEEQNTACKANLAEQEALTQVRVRELQLLQKEQEIMELQGKLNEIQSVKAQERGTQVNMLIAKKKHDDRYYQDDEMPYEFYMDYLFKRKQAAIGL